MTIIFIQIMLLNSVISTYNLKFLKKFVLNGHIWLTMSISFPAIHF